MQMSGISSVSSNSGNSRQRELKWGAKVNLITEYRFYPQNYSVARAAFAQPCIPYEDTGPNRVGFWSGFQPVALVLSNVR
jgi:hypothetical protein